MRLSRFKIVRSRFHGGEVAAPLHRCACAGVCAFVVVGLACKKQVSSALVHVQVCTLHRYLSTPVHVFANTPQGVHMRSCMHSLFISVGGRGGGVQLVAYCWRGALFWTEKIEVLSLFSLFLDGDGSVCGCMCVYARTHTHTAYEVLGREPRGRDKTPGESEESKWTKSWHICIRICVQSTQVHMYSERRDEILD